MIFIIKNIIIFKGFYFLFYLEYLEVYKKNLYKFLIFLKKSRSSLMFWQSFVYFLDVYIICVCFGIFFCSNIQVGGIEEYFFWGLNIEKKEI